ncbi:MAG: DUF2806 domain-containing protein [Methanocorpusculaceae archaeon]|nr:DUF2806 domain-containing protein [Methanocorpusculaceae archaeon]
MIENNAVKVNLEKVDVETGKGIGKLAEAFFGYMGLKAENKHEIKTLKILTDRVLSNPNQLVEYHGKTLSITPNSPIEERARLREDAQSTRKQNNLETVVLHASNELNDDSEVSDEPVDDYWATRFFDMAADISGEDMQIIWGKILAGEIKRPNSYSIRTLELLRSLTTQEIQALKETLPYIIVMNSDYFIISVEDILKKYNINFNRISMLIESNFLSPITLVVEKIHLKGGVDTVQKLFNKNYVICMNCEGEDDRKFDLPIYSLTFSGKELVKLLQPEGDKQYMLDVVNYLRNKVNPPIKVTMHEIKEWAKPFGGFSYSMHDISNEAEISDTKSTTDSIQE